jgi:hypothetical protein
LSLQALSLLIFDRYGTGMTEPLPELPESWDRCLCVVAHPDDIEYGTASAVARWTAQGKQVTYLLASRGEAGIDSVRPEDAAPLREREERAGASEVGVDVVESSITVTVSSSTGRRCAATSSGRSGGTARRSSCPGTSTCGASGA